MRRSVRQWLRRSAVVVVSAALLAAVAYPGTARKPPGQKANATTMRALLMPAAEASGQPGRATVALARPEDAGSTTIDPDADRTAPQGGDPDVERARAALRSLRFPWQRLGYRVVFSGPRPDRLATTHRPSRTITLHLRRAQSTTTLRATLAHEIGHALDFTYGSLERHRRYLEVRGLPAGTTWYPCSSCDDLSSPAGDYAEVFAYSLVGAGDFRSRLAGPPDRRQLEQLADLLAIPSAPRQPPSRPTAAASPSPSPTGASLLGGLPPPPRQDRHPTG